MHTVTAQSDVPAHPPMMGAASFQMSTLSDWGPHVLSQNQLPRHGRRLCRPYAPPHSARSFVTATLAPISSSNGRGNVMGLPALVGLPTFLHRHCSDLVE